MPRTVYLPGRNGRDTLFYECRHCGWRLPEPFYDKVVAHEEIPVSGEGLHCAVLVQARRPWRYVLLTKSHTSREHEVMYDVSAICATGDSGISPCRSDFLTKLRTLSPSEIEKRIARSALRGLDAGELEEVNDMVFGQDYLGEHSGRFGTSAFRTL